MSWSWTYVGVFGRVVIGGFFTYVAGGTIHELVKADAVSRWVKVLFAVVVVAFATAMDVTLATHAGVWGPSD